MALVYLVIGPAGKKYVGMTSKTLLKRKANHLSDARRGRSGSPAFHNALRAHGEAAFTWRVLADNLTNDEALRAEVGFISLLQTTVPEGYNLTAGGQFNVQNAESVERSASKRRGLKRSPESRARMSEAQRGRPGSRVAIEAMRAANIGKKRDPSVGRKISERLVGRSPRRTAKLLAGYEARRELSPAQVTNVHILASLGATRRATGSWFGVSYSTVTNVILGKRGYPAKQGTRP